MGIIKAKNVVHEFFRRDEEGNVESITTALDHVNLDVKAGQFIAILGHNGSGKSTLAKHINALLTPTEGVIWVDGMDVLDEDNTIPIRKTAGMVFQNPDNQIIASVVEEDVGFGPENIGVPTEEIWTRVNQSLEAVDMGKYRKHSPNKLSGGQKQRVAIAGVVAMEPKCIVFDEPTAMLDPNGRKEVIATAHDLNKKKGVTIILITHYMEEVVDADYVYVMEKGKIVMDGTPRDIFSRVDELKEHRLDVPQATLVADELRSAGVPIPQGILTRKELVDAIMALKDVNLQIHQGEFIGIIGHTGSGKSTLTQLLNGLLRASSGSIYVDGQDIYDEGYDMKALRSKVGLVFQYPDHQLFETTCFEDVCFGPKNQGLDRRDIELRAFEALRNVGFPEELFYQPPFDLSGGQKRRVAIAGVLAMKPDVLILDEPTAGLDPAGRDEILGLVSKMHRELGITILLVSHSMEDVAEYVDRIIVMNHGAVMFDALPKQVFAHYKELEAVGLAAPQVTYLVHELAERGLPVDTQATTAKEAAQTILSALREKNVI